ncbi:MAG: NAD kinase [Microbacteriaceae bacterium]
MSDAKKSLEPGDAQRYVLVVVHVGREEALSSANSVVEKLLEAGISPVLPPEEFRTFADDQPKVLMLGRDIQLEELELCIVLGGDGTILRAAELAHEARIPILGVNLGHVGFLAQSERAEQDATIQHVVDRDYLVEERVVIEVRVLLEGKEIFRSWALNEAAIEKANRERMLELALEVDGHPVSSYGADGVLLSTPTGSTAYAFSSGGPIMWPDLDALLIVPLNAHALFSRPLILSPKSSIAVELLERNQGTGVLWLDGRRSVALEPGSRIEAKRSETPVLLARLSPENFAERLVKKFNLPVTGWRGPREAG